MGKSRARLSFALLAVTLLVGCALQGADMGSPTAPGPATPPGSGDLTGTIPMPMPSRTPIRETPDPTPGPTGGWSEEGLHVGVNQVRGVMFADADVVWAATTGGAVRWDLATGSHLQLTERDGLASNLVNDVAQGPDGSLWFATLGGVSRLKGDVWTTYAEADGLVSDAVQTLVVVRDGIVWAGTTEGVSRFDGDSWTTFLPGDRAWQIAVAPDGALWFATDAAGLRRYSRAELAWDTFRKEDDPQTPGVKTVSVAPDGGVWTYLGYDQVYRFDGERWEAAYDAGGQWVCDAAFEADGTPWIATCDGYHARGAGLATQDAGSWKHVGREEGLASESVWAVAVGPGGQVAAGTARGLSVYREGTWRTLRDGPALNRITAAAVTPDGTAWFGFGANSFPPPGGGISRFDGESWEYLGRSSGLPINENVHFLTVGPAGGLWAGAGCELAVRRDGAWERVVGCDELSGNVLDVGFGPEGDVWLATDFNVRRFDGQTWETWESLLPTSMVVTPEGTALIGQSLLGEGGVWSFDGEAWQRLAEGPSCVRELVVDGEGVVWGLACEGDGLHRWDGSTWERVDATDGLPVGSIMDVAGSADGTVWVVTEGGIGWLGEEGWSVHERTWEGDVREMAVAPDGSVWLATSRGAVRVSPKTMAFVEGGRAVRTPLRMAGRADG